MWRGTLWHVPTRDEIKLAMRAAVKRKGLNQQQFADAVGVERTYANKWLSLKDRAPLPGPDYGPKVAEILGMTLDEITPSEGLLPAQAAGVAVELAALRAEVAALRAVIEAAPALGHAGGGSEPTPAAVDAAMAEAARVLEEAGRQILALAAGLQSPAGGWVRSIPGVGCFLRQSVQRERPLVSQREWAGLRQSSHRVRGTIGMGAPTR